MEDSVTESKWPEIFAAYAGKTAMEERNRVAPEMKSRHSKLFFMFDLAFWCYDKMS